MISIDSVKILKIDPELKRVLSTTLNMEPLTDTISEIKFVKGSQYPIFEIVLPNKRSFTLYQYKFMWIAVIGPYKIFLSTTKDIQRAINKIERLSGLPEKAETPSGEEPEIDVTSSDIEREKSAPEPPAEEEPEPEA
jgi:hypothetical protein